MDPKWTLTGNNGPLPDYGWVPSTSTSVPAGQESGVEEEIWPPSAQILEDQDAITRSLQPSGSNDVLQGSALLVSAASDVTPSQTSGDTFQCQICFESFLKPYLLKYSRPGLLLCSFY